MFRKPGERRERKEPLVQKESRFESGTEMDVSRLRLHYGARQIDGFLLKEPTSGTPEWKREFTRDVFHKWEQLRKINLRRRQENKTTFALPRTVRLLDTEEHCGILVTDLSQGGTRKVFDLKRLFYERRVSFESWLDIRKQIEQDIDIAQEEGIKLDNGPSNVDHGLWFRAIMDIKLF